MKAVHGNSKSRRSLANIYAIYSILYFYQLQQWTDELNNNDIDGIIRDIDIYYKLEMNMDANDEE